jgi:hypothetical protein
VSVSEHVLGSGARDFYRSAMKALDAAGVPFLVGGAYAFARYTAIARHTKDFDIFVHPSDCERTQRVFEAEGFSTTLAFAHWLGKAYRGEHFVDIIFGSGNGVALVDAEWFEHAVDDEVLDVPVKLCPPEETIWSKAFIQERERFDGADIAHILRARAATLDWERLLRRFGEHWRVLLSHLVLFGFVYPGERSAVPEGVMKELMRRLDGELTVPDPRRICQGTILSRTQYLPDLELWGYEDPRICPAGNMTREEAERWTAAGRETER